MFSKKIAAFLIAGLMVVFTNQAAKAEFISASLGLPVMYSFSDSAVTSDGIIGGKAYVNLPFIGAFGLESYAVGIKDTANDTVATQGKALATVMIDYGYLLPIPIINILVGVGVGQSTVACTLCSGFYDSGTATQVYAQLGMSILPILGVHVSYHKVTSKVAAKTDAVTVAAGAVDIDASGTMATIGVSVGF